MITTNIKRVLVSVAAMLLASPPVSLRRYNGNTLGIFTGNVFSFKTTLPEPDKEVQFTFSVVRHGMVPPFKKSFSIDMSRHKFGTIWKVDQATERGNQLMTMVGRSLRTRYKPFLDSLKWDQISVTTLDNAWTVSNGEYLLQGLLQKTSHQALLEQQLSEASHQPVLEEQQSEAASGTLINKEGIVDYDRLNLQYDSECSWLDKILKDELYEELQIPDNTVTLKYCTPKFYEALRKFVLIPTESKEGNMWWIESPEHVYKLWKLLWFEVQEGVGLYQWSKRYWPNIVACVFEYVRLQMDWHPDVAPAIVGRMFNKIKEEKEEGKMKFHLHITDDITVTALLWNLPGNTRTLLSDYGDAVILDFYKDNTVSVSLFSGMMETYETIDTYDYETLKNHLKNKGLDLTIDEYKVLCSFNPDA